MARGIAKNIDDYAENVLGPFLERMFAVEDDKARYRQQFIDLFIEALTDQITPDEFDAALNELWQETENYPSDAFHIAFSEEKEIIGDVFESQDRKRTIRRARKRLERIVW